MREMMKEKYVERLRALRQVMQEKQIDIYYIPTNDFHGSEYVGEYFKCRKYMSGFTGSAGTLVVMQEEAGLWTDGRYFLQAEEQLDGTGITLYRMQEEGVTTIDEYLKQKLAEGMRLGFDGRVVSGAYARQLAGIASAKQAVCVSSIDLVGDIWQNRPSITALPAYSLHVKYTGVERTTKMQKVKEWMERKSVDVFVLTSLDDIAWMLNIRGEDVPCNPVVYSYFIMTKNDRLFFVQDGAIGERLNMELAKDRVMVRDYEEAYSHLSRMESGLRIAMDLRVVNYAMLQAVPQGSRIMDTINPTTLMKAQKNTVEVANEKNAHIRDGVAFARFLFWLKTNQDKLPLTEMIVSDKLEEFRQSVGNYMGPSFDPISAYAEHGAIVHYSATPETNASIQLENFLLMDTGGQYLEGTTDITRTLLMGHQTTPEQKRYYTAVLRGNLNLAAAKFKYGCSGVALDYLARQPLWEMGCDYNHGTGHGVGYFLNVHEGPNSIRYRVSNAPGGNTVFEEGMITSDEPGIYLTGKFGIRLENLIVCVKKEKNEFGQFMGFETLTLVPFEREAIDPDQMTEKEKQLLNQYHATVFEKISPYLNRNEAEWLADACAAL